VTPALSILIAAAAAAAIAAEAKGRYRRAYVLRPATMGAIIALAAWRISGRPSRFALFILAGLAASLAGDVFMMLRKKRFVEGLAAFLAAQLLYIAALLSVMPPRVSLGTALPLLVFALFMMRILIPRAGRMKAPVAVYLVAITVMAALAAERFIVVGGISALSTFAAALLFVVSDSILAVNRFAKTIPSAQILILSSYYAAQYLFALSI
jgi:uncharacterized membrane protein YhhN